MFPVLPVSSQPASLLSAFLSLFLSLFPPGAPLPLHPVFILAQCFWFVLNMSCNQLLKWNKENSDLWEEIDMSDRCILMISVY